MVKNIQFREVLIDNITNAAYRNPCELVPSIMKFNVYISHDS